MYEYIAVLYSVHSKFYTAQYECTVHYERSSACACAPECVRRVDVCHCAGAAVRVLHVRLSCERDAIRCDAGVECNVSQQFHHIIQSFL